MFVANLATEIDSQNQVNKNKILAQNAFLAREGID